MENKDGWNATGITVNIPNRVAERLQRQIRNGDAKDADQAITTALEIWLKGLEKYYLEDRDELERIVKENVSSDKGMKQLRKEGKRLEEL